MTLRRPLIAVFGALALSGSFLFAACGGDDGDSGSASATFDTKKADDLAHQALLTVKDLPGKGWEVTEEDELDESDLPDTKNCKPITDGKARAKELMAGKKKAETQRKIERDGTESVTEIETQVTVLDTAKTASLSLAEAKKAYDGDGFVACFQETLAGPDAPKGVKFVTTVAKAGTSAPNGGIAKAADITISDGKNTLDLHTETYIWSYGNGDFQVTLSGDKADVTPELAKAAVSAVQKNAERLAK